MLRLVSRKYIFFSLYKYHVEMDIITGYMRSRRRGGGGAGAGGGGDEECV